MEWEGENSIFQVGESDSNFDFLDFEGFENNELKVRWYGGSSEIHVLALWEDFEIPEGRLDSNMLSIPLPAYNFEKERTHIRIFGHTKQGRINDLADSSAQWSPYHE